MKLVSGGSPPFQVIRGGRDIAAPTATQLRTRSLALVRVDGDGKQASIDPQTPKEFLASDPYMTSRALGMMLDTETVSMENWWANAVLRLFIPDEDRAEPLGTRLLVCAMIRLTGPQGAVEASHLRALQTADWSLSVKFADGPERTYLFVQPAQDGDYCEEVVTGVGQYRDEAVLRRVFALRQRCTLAPLGQMYNPELEVRRLMLGRGRPAPRIGVPAAVDEQELFGAFEHGLVTTLTVPLHHITGLWTE